jgi:hypothetical protein
LFDVRILRRITAALDTATTTAVIQRAPPALRFAVFLMVPLACRLRAIVAKEILGVGICTRVIPFMEHFLLGIMAMEMIGDSLSQAHIRRITTQIRVARV